jgi:hypothetical protein
MQRKARLDYCFAAAIRTCRGEAVGEDGGSNHPATKISEIREIRAKK